MDLKRSWLLKMDCLAVKYLSAEGLRTREDVDRGDRGAAQISIVQGRRKDLRSLNGKIVLENDFFGSDQHFL